MTTTDKTYANLRISTKIEHLIEIFVFRKKKKRPN